MVENAQREKEGLKDGLQFQVVHGLNKLVINSKSPVMHRYHIKERNKRTSLWSHLTKPSPDLNFLLHASGVFCSLTIACI